MKMIYAKCLSLALLLVLLAGCKKYLDIIPDNVATIDNAFKMRVDAEKYLFTCYNNLPLFGNEGADPGFLTGDEFATPYPPQGDINTELYRIARGEQNIVSPIANYWDNKFFQAIRECNIFLENVDKVRDLNDLEKKRWVAEVKFLKAYYHYYLLRMYGPIPIIKTNLPISASIEEVKVSRQHVDSVFNYTVTLMDEAIADLPAVLPIEFAELGRITKSIAMSVKAEVLVTAASPLFNGNPNYANLKNKNGDALFSTSVSGEKWEKARDACKAAIDACTANGNKLYEFVPRSVSTRVSDTTQLLMSIRAALTDKWNSELIWGASNSTGGGGRGFQSLSQARLSPFTGTIPNESIGSMLAPPLHIAEMFYSSNGVPIEEDKTYPYAKRYSTLRKALASEKYYIKEGYTTVQLNYDREPRFYADLGFDGGIWFGQGKNDDNNTWVLEGKLGQTGGRQGASLYSVTGYWPKKLVNYNNAINDPAQQYTVEGYPFPIMRLADLYLLYAEALNETAGPDAEVYRWLDLVRKRAGLKGVVESWTKYSSKPSKVATKDGLREIIQRERMIELVFESKRFWDLRRWKVAENYLQRPINGWDITQREAVNYYRVRPVFTSTFSLKDYFWPISEKSLIVNPNLVQNPGW
ncbi:RagB/SusD family nutrient uptake outer membrane protein [Dyadobacter sp. 50-39]|uniref:RagB/SusD family nutrient uptake outer membrane protein n=1 Tax=Dyadobacter sp. 50-39 TaxID=1895756 RepID=UPI000A96A77A|nr:RagB/SusD family nutrient uptake outer membrane protein [Dyadobacter sp. 50-39]